MLYSPVVVNSRTLSSRTWIPAMVPWRATEEGFVTDDVIDWYARFAKGKPGTIVVEATAIRDVASGPLMRAGHPRFVPGLKRLVEAVKDASQGETSVFIQLIDFLQVRRRPPADKFFTRFLAITQSHRQGLATVDADPSWLERSEEDVRARLVTMKEESLGQILSPREFGDLYYGYRERAWDTHLPLSLIHI